MNNIKKYGPYIFGAVVVLAFVLFLLLGKSKRIEFSKTQEKNISTKIVDSSSNSLPKNAAENISSEDVSVTEDDSQNENTSSRKTAKTENKNIISSNNDSRTEGGDDKNISSDNESAPKIINRLVNWGFQKASGRKIDTIVIHSTYNAVGSDPFDLNDIINKEYKPYGVSPHYIIDREGKIYRLVEDQNIAYHAGESKMPDGRENVNSFSIGIEIVTSKSTKPTSDQYDSLKNLISYLKGKYDIKNVLGHKDIAPGRKDDPWNFELSRVK